MTEVTYHSTRQRAGSLSEIHSEVSDFVVIIGLEDITGFDVSV